MHAIQIGIDEWSCKIFINDRLIFLKSDKIYHTMAAAISSLKKEGSEVAEILGGELIYTFNELTDMERRYFVFINKIIDIFKKIIKKLNILCPFGKRA